MRCRRGEGATGCACCRVLMFSVVLPHATPTRVRGACGAVRGVTSSAGVVSEEMCARAVHADAWCSALR